MSDVRRSFFWSYSTKYALLVVQFVTTVIIARLVTPDDIGIYTVAAVFIGLGQLIREFGVNRYIIQEKELTAHRIRAASTLNLLFGWGTGVAVFLAANAVGAFYERTEIREVMHLLSINFVFVPLGAITFAFLRRQMRFRTIMTIRVTSATIGAIAGITTAWHGEGYRALVWSSMAGTITTVIICLIYKPKEISLAPGFKEIGHVFRFCRYAGAESIISHFGNTAPDWILGKVQGMQMVGLFSRASSTIAMFRAVVMEGLVGVLLPYFSKKFRDGERSDLAYAHLVGCITGLAWPFFTILGLLAAPIVELLYGSQWREAVPLVRAMSLGAQAMALTIAAGDLLAGLGQIRTLFHINLTIALLKVALLATVASQALVIVVITLQIIPLIRLVLVSRQISRLIGLRLRDMSQALITNLLLSFLCALPAVIGIWIYGWTLEYSTPRLLLILGASGLVWLGSIYLIKPPLYQEIHPIVLKLLGRQRKQAR